MKIKHLLLGFGALALTLTSCDLNSASTKETTTPISTTNEIPSVSTNNNESTVNDTPTTTTKETTTPISTNTVPTTTTMPVVSTTTALDASREKPSDLSKTSTLYIVGDSTVDEFKKEDGSIKDSTYFYERCGWGGHIVDYSENLTIKNYGMSGRSSKDYLGTDYYSTIKNNIKAGDYLMIGFGHNDEKSDDADRFTDASKDITDPTSFKYSLYENYIKMAEDKGATPILCTPIVRLSASNDYSGSTAHITSTGDYRKAIVELGEEKDVKVIDLTTYTKDLYTKLGYNEARYFHAMTGGLSDDEVNLLTVDATHINNYGAKYFDYFIAKELYDDENCYLGNYIKDEIKMPTKENDLVKNPLYKYVEYSSPNLSSYSPASQFKTTTSGWYGTAFGDTGGDPTVASNGYYAQETSSGVFKVGQSNGATSYKGKISSTSEGIAFLFKQISINDNFEFSVKAKILTISGDGKQDGFGIMLRDACWLPENNKGILSNYVAAGVFRNKSTEICANFSRSSLTAITQSGNSISYPKVDDTFEFKITRTGQSVECITIYNGKTYKTNYLDFDFVAKDTNYFYLGMFGARGTVVEFSDLSYTKTGESQGA